MNCPFRRTDPFSPRTRPNKWDRAGRSQPLARLRTSSGWFSAGAGGKAEFGVERRRGKRRNSDSGRPRPQPVGMERCARILEARFSSVAAAEGDVRAPIASVARVLAPPAPTRAGLAQRAIPTIPTIPPNTYGGIAPNFRCPCGTFCGDWPSRVVEPEGVMKLLTVRF
jgi:hypothetical protein